MEEQANRKGGKRKGLSEVTQRVKLLMYLTIFSSVAYGYIIIAMTAYLPSADLITPGEAGPALSPLYSQ
jgi:hypothetical protein